MKLPKADTCCAPAAVEAKTRVSKGNTRMRFMLRLICMVRFYTIGIAYYNVGLPLYPVNSPPLLPDRERFKLRMFSKGIGDSMTSLKLALGVTTLVAFSF